MTHTLFNNKLLPVDNWKFVSNNKEAASIYLTESARPINESISD